MTIDRRTFLASLPIAGALGRGSGGRHPWTFGAHPLSALEHVGLELYTVRTLLSEDLEGTLAAVAEIGYREVELAGLPGVPAGELRRVLDGVGLRAVSSHASLYQIRTQMGRLIDDAQTLAQGWVVVPGMDAGERTTEGLKRVADDFNQAGAAARAAGLRFGYHNHAWELEPLPDGTRPMDLLLERCDPALVDWQMDIYWTVHGGADPLAYLDAHPGRVTTVHVKDRAADGAMVDVGAGVIDFPAILNRAMESGLSHAFVEHDTPSDPLASIRASFAHVRPLLGVGAGG